MESAGRCDSSTYTKPATNLYWAWRETLSVYITHWRAQGNKKSFAFIPLLCQLENFNDQLKNVIIPPANCVCGRVYCFHVVRPNERTNERKCVRNVLFP